VPIVNHKALLSQVADMELLFLRQGMTLRKRHFKANWMEWLGDKDAPSGHGLVGKDSRIQSLATDHCDHLFVGEIVQSYFCVWRVPAKAGENLRQPGGGQRRSIAEIKEC